MNLKFLNRTANTSSIILKSSKKKKSLIPVWGVLNYLLKLFVFFALPHSRILVNLANICKYSSQAFSLQNKRLEVTDYVS